MVFEERNAWAGLILTPLVMIVYVVLVLQDAGGGPLTDVDWFPLMLWVIGGGIVVTIAVTIGWGLIAGIKDPDGVGRSDIRDRDISRMGGRVEQGFVVIAGLGVIALCSVFTAPLGAKAAHNLPVKKLKRVFASILYLLAAYMLWKGLSG